MPESNRIGSRPSDDGQFQPIVLHVDADGDGEHFGRDAFKPDRFDALLQGELVGLLLRVIPALGKDCIDEGL
jgi:hypothetical protein